MKNLVTLGDSIVGSYKLPCMLNTYSNLLARRLGLKFCQDNYSGTSTPTMLYYLRRSKEIINDLKDAAVVTISVGGNSLYMNMLNTAMMSMGLTMNDLSLAFINDTKFNIDAKFIASMVKAFASPDMKSVIKDNVERFKIEYPIIIDAIHDVNSDAVVIGQTIHNSLEESKSLLYIGINKLLAPSINEMNNVVRTLHRSNFIYTDFNELLKNYRGEDSLTHFNDGTNKFDTHLTAAGHVYFYNREYETLTSAYPDFICEEHDDIIKKDDNLTDEDKHIIAAKDKRRAEYITALKNLKSNPPIEYKAVTDCYNDYVKYFHITSVGANMDIHPREMWLTPDKRADQSDMISGYPVYFEAAEGEDIVVLDIHMRRIGVIKNDGSDYINGIIGDIVSEDFYNVAYLHNTNDKTLILIGHYGPKLIFQK